MSAQCKLSAVVLGCGYVGQRLLRRLPQGTALGLSRSQPSHVNQWLSLDLDSDPLDALCDVVGDTVLYYFAAPSVSSLCDDRSRRVVDALQRSGNKPAAVVLISTTGVYGDCGGEWVTEQRPVLPVAARSKRRADAEQAWSEYCARADLPLAVLRVAGIYGPDKLPTARLSQEQPLLLEAQSPFSNRVHVDDLIDTALAAAGQSILLNVADGSPSTMTAYFHALADALAVPRLPEAEREQLAAQWSAGLRSYMSESRRIDNTRMRTLLGGALRYPDLSLGLAACVRESRAGE